MNVLSYEELDEINGGAKSLSYTLALIIGGAIALVLGIINGYNHTKCQ